jgi:hypothetical protein
MTPPNEPPLIVALEAVSTEFPDITIPVRDSLVMRLLLFFGKNLHFVLGRNGSDSEYRWMVDGRKNSVAAESGASGIPFWGA